MYRHFLKSLSIVALSSSALFAQNFASTTIANNAGPSPAAFGPGQTAASFGFMRSPTNNASGSSAGFSNFSAVGSGFNTVGSGPVAVIDGGYGVNAYAPFGPGSDLGHYYRGLAALNRSAGEYNYDSSAADINEQEAVRRYQKNQVESVEKYWERRRINEANRLREYNPPTMDEARAMARMDLPKRLTTSQLEPVTGIILWPDVFNDRDFLSLRSTVDDSMVNRQTGGVGSADYHQVVVATGHMEQILKAKLNWLTPTEYTQAKRFLQSVRYEAQLQPNLNGLARK